MNEPGFVAPVPEFKIEVVHIANEDESCRTFVINGENHTLGASLKYMIMKDPTVDFCGYTIPHPSESRIKMRIQTAPGHSALVALKYGLENLKKQCMHMRDVYDATVRDSLYGLMD